MSKYSELVHLVLDELKLISDDSHFQQEHILFLLDKYRVFLIKQKYSDIKKEIPDSNLQTICVDLERVNSINGSPCDGSDYLRSVQKIPLLSTVYNPKVSSLDYFRGNFSYVSRERFKYVGFNKFLKNQIYSTIAPDSYLYIKSTNPQIYYLEKVKITGVFEDSEQAAALQCQDSDEEGTCDIMDKRFPLEESLVPLLVELIVKELSGSQYKPADTTNNAADDFNNVPQSDNRK